MKSTVLPIQHRAAAIAWWIAVCVALACGCSTPRALKTAPVPYQPSNFSATRTHLTPEMARIAVAAPRRRDGLGAGKGPTLAALERVYAAELHKSAAFSVVFLDGNDMESLAGARSLDWRSPRRPNRLGILQIWLRSGRRAI